MHDITLLSYRLYDSHQHIVCILHHNFIAHSAGIDLHCKLKCLPLDDKLSYFSLKYHRVGTVLDLQNCKYQKPRPNCFNKTGKIYNYGLTCGNFNLSSRGITLFHVFLIPQNSSNIPSFPMWAQQYLPTWFFAKLHQLALQAKILLFASRSKIPNLVAALFNNYLATSGENSLGISQNPIKVFTFSPEVQDFTFNVHDTFDAVFLKREGYTTFFPAEKRTSRNAYFV